jgi:hypothetical protein
MDNGHGNVHLPKAQTHLSTNEKIGRRQTFGEQHGR